MSFLVKYKVQINIFLLFFWGFILYQNYLANNFKGFGFIAPLLFITLAIINIYKGLKQNKTKSED